MNVRIFGNSWIVRLCLLLYCLVAQEKNALACFTGWQSEGDDCYAFVINADEFGGVAHWSRDWIGMVDPVRGSPPPSFVWPYTGVFGSGMTGYGGCYGFNIYGASVSQQSSGGFVPDSCVPVGRSGTSMNGYFLEFFEVWGDDRAKSAKYYISWWIVDGKCTATPPPPPPDSQPPLNAPTGGQTGPSSVAVTVVDKAGKGIPYVFAYLYGPTAGTVTCDTNGSAVFKGCAAGLYQVHIIGNLKSSSGTGVHVDYTQQFSLSSSESKSLTFHVNDAGIVSSTDQGSSASGGGSDSAPGWLQSTVSSLFVPDQAHIDQTKANLAAYINWGPFALIQQMATLKDQPAANNNPLGIPVPVWEAKSVDPVTQEPKGCGCYSFAGGQSVPISLPNAQEAQASGYSTFRSLLGGAVWLVFLVGVAKIFMPRQQL